MEDQVLSIEQMQELIELGIDTSKASMVMTDNGEIVSSIQIPEIASKWIPTYTLQDILSILPEEIQNHKLESDLKGYIHYVFRGVKLIHNLKAIECTTMLEAAFSMLKWCKQNNFILL